MNLSAIIITRDSENVIEGCLKSVSFADEIIVVDAGSSDNTRSIAKQLRATIVNGSENNFSEQRTIGFKAAKGEWILYVDADERVTSSLSEEIIQYTNNPIYKFSSLKIRRKNFYYGKHEWPYIEHIMRLFRKDALKGWQGVLHESPIISGNIGELKGFLLHYSHQDLFSMVEKTNKWSQTEAMLRSKQKHPKMQVWRFFRVMSTSFFDSYFKQSGWKVGTAGIVESTYQAFSIFITYAKLWELQNNEL